MVGKGSVNHNSRAFHAKNTDPQRSGLNITYQDEDIRDVYHTLFDKALEQYNAKQKRSDRTIPDYYEKIRSGKQEKPFHELVIQIGNRDDTGADTEEGQLAEKVLDAYMKGFQGRNPNLRVFSAHLHMDEATPHLHIDFVPFTTGSKRGLETRVSLKKALEAQGFKGGTRGDTEWNQWVNAEKEQLAALMQEHNIEWEKLGTHEEHLSVLDYKKQERAKEIAALDVQAQQLQTAVEQREAQVEALEDTIGQRTEEIAGLEQQKSAKEAESAALDTEIKEKQTEAAKVEQTLERVKTQQLRVSEIEAVKARPIPLSNQVMLSRDDYETITAAAERLVVRTKQEGKLKRLLNEAVEKIQRLEAALREKVAEIAALRQELSEFKSIRGRLDRAKLEAENRELKRENGILIQKLAELGIHWRPRATQRENRMEL